MQGSKVQFSEKERLLMADMDVILTKNAIIDKTYTLLGALSERLVPVWEPVAARMPQMPACSPKIARGEKYEGMPWVVLDYPRVFSKTLGYCAFRTFFWWGHYFSLQLLLSGSYFQHFFQNNRFFIPPDNVREYPVWAGITPDVWNFAVPEASISGTLPIVLPAELPAGQVFKCMVSIPLADAAEIPTWASQWLADLVRERF